MNGYRFYDHLLFERLSERADILNGEAYHLRELVGDPNRLKNFQSIGGGLFFDYSRQRIDTETMSVLYDLAEAAGAQQRFSEMAKGEKVNLTENRAALHMTARSFSKTPVLVDGTNVAPEIMAVREKIRHFSEAVRQEKIVGSTGKPFRHVVVVGIGGSYLGTEFVATALEALSGKKISLSFLANVDIHNFGNIWRKIDPKKTLWIVISKSYTTVETMANVDLMSRCMKEKGLDPLEHLVTVTSKGSPGDQGEGKGLEAFHMFDFIGGRYSVASAVGGVPLSLYLGYDCFERFLRGAEEMDQHAVNASPKENLPLIAALLTVWNTSFLGYPQAAIIPYASPLAKLTPHVQQLNMESNGKSVDLSGAFLDKPSGTVIFGEPGTNAQHSFFQLAHQGNPFPIDFIGVLNPQFQMEEGRYKGVGHQQELWANLLAQASALAEGRDNEDSSKFFSGNRPSSILVLEDLEPESVGRLLAFYEAKTIFEAFLWGINPFDQFGVELGKVNAGALRKEMAARNTNQEHDFSTVDPINRKYLQMIFSGRLPSDL